MRKNILIGLLALGICFTLGSCGEFSNADSSSDSANISSDSSDSINDSVSSSSDDSSSSEQAVFYTVTFKQNGQADIVKTVEEGESLTEIPVPVAKTGYNVIWATSDFSNITENMTVEAIETAKTYTITLNANGGNVQQTTLIVTYGQNYELPTPTDSLRDFGGWYYNGALIGASGVWGIDTENIKLTAKWMKNWTNFY